MTEEQDRENERLINELHASPHYGIFVEVGAGMPVAASILSLPGASRTLFAAYCPYSKDAQEDMFGPMLDRAVSENHVRFDVCAMLKKYRENEDINFIYHSSFQLGEPNSDTNTHGWVCIAKRKLPKGDSWYVDMYHITRNTNKHRGLTIEELGNTCLRILANNLLYDTFTPKAGIDIYRSCLTVNYPMGPQSADFQDHIFDVVDNLADDGYVCIVDGKLVRLEDFFRAQPEVALYKGSFAPPTLAHIGFAEKFEKFRGAKPAFMISMDTFEKGAQQTDSVMWRVKLLNKLGYPVVINRNGYFYDNADFFRKRFKKPIAFLVGSDTLNRTIEHAKTKGHNDAMLRVSKNPFATEGKQWGDWTWSFSNDPSFEGVIFYVAIRPGIPILPEGRDERVWTLTTLTEISSTEVRKFKADKNMEGLRSMVPELILQDYLNIAS